MSKNIDKYVYSNKPIGKGAYSKVYKGFDTETDEVIALKILIKDGFNSSMNKRLKDEIIILKHLDHPNIIELKDTLEDDEHYYLVLEYCSGGDLSKLIKKGPIHEDVANSYMKQLANALCYLQTKKILHRDLKPHNILLNKTLTEIKLTDFNFAREMFTDLTETLCGSPLYMAPEILEKEKYGVKSDLWSVGIILYEMVYGKNPYTKATNILDLVNKIKKTRIVYDNTVSMECNNLLEGLLQKNPDERMSWSDFFNNSWLNQISNDDFENIISSDILPSCSPSDTEFRIVENYVPLCVSPPKITKSDPLKLIEFQCINRPSFGSAPSMSFMDNIVSFMTRSFTKK